MKVTQVELIEKAQGLIQDAITLLEEALSEDDEAQSYVVDHLKIFATDDHGFLSNDLNLDELIRRYEHGKEIRISAMAESILNGEQG